MSKSLALGLPQEVVVQTFKESWGSVTDADLGKRNLYHPFGARVKENGGGGAKGTFNEWLRGYFVRVIKGVDESLGCFGGDVNETHGVKCGTQPTSLGGSVVSPSARNLERGSKWQGL